MAHIKRSVTLFAPPLSTIPFSLGRSWLTAKFYLCILLSVTLFFHHRVFLVETVFLFVSTQLLLKLCFPSVALSPWFYFYVLWNLSFLSLSILPFLSKFRFLFPLFLSRIINFRLSSELSVTLSFTLTLFSLVRILPRIPTRRPLFLLSPALPDLRRSYFLAPGERGSR